MIEKLEVDRGPLALRNSVVGGKTGLLPAHSKIHGQGHTELLVVDLSDIFMLNNLSFKKISRLDTFLIQMNTLL
jgi:hypothetical protein